TPGLAGDLYQSRSNPDGTDSLAQPFNSGEEYSVSAERYGAATTAGRLAARTTAALPAMGRYEHRRRLPRGRPRYLRRPGRQPDWPLGYSNTGCQPGGGYATSYPGSG